MQQLTLAAMRNYLQKHCPRRIDEIVIHHTWRPTAKQYKGLNTWQSIKNYHVFQNGWSDIGYHFGVGPDGSFWALRPFERSGAHVLNRNANTIGVCMLGDYDQEDPRQIVADTIRLTDIIRQRFNLNRDRIRFHREFQNKTCPGVKVDIGWFTGASHQPSMPALPPMAVVIGSKVVDCAPKIFEDRLYVKALPFANALGYARVPESIHIHDSGYALATALAHACGWVLGAQQYVVSEINGQRIQRWYPKLPEWMEVDGGNCV